MPTYEFRCAKGHDFEKFYRSMSAAPLQVPCPICGKMAQRQMSAGAGLVFKGSGFYITDYGKDGKKAPAPATTAGASDASAVSGSSGSTESSGAKSETAAKSDTKPVTEAKSSGEAKPAAASKSAAKKSAGRAKSSE